MRSLRRGFYHRTTDCLGNKGDSNTNSTRKLRPKPDVIYFHHRLHVYLGSSITERPPLAGKDINASPLPRYFQLAWIDERFSLNLEAPTY